MTKAKQITEVKVELENGAIGFLSKHSFKKFSKALDTAEQRGREEALKKVRKGKIFVSSYGCIDCHKLIPNTCDRCRRLRSS